MFFVSRRKDLGFVDVVDADLLKNLSPGELSDASLGHDGDGDGCHDLADLLDRCHASDPTLRANLCRNTFESHHGGSSSTFGDLGLAGISDVHNDAALEHFSQSGL